MSRWPVWSLLAGVGALAALAAYSLIRYPAILRDPAAPSYLVALGIAVAGYFALAAWAVRRPAAGGSLGAVVGLAAGAAWSAEIWAGGPAKLDRSVEQVVGATFALLAVAVTVAAGIVAGLRTHRPATAARAGLLAGLVSGVVVFCFAVVMTLTSLGVLATRPDYREQFASSHAPDMPTYLVGDILAAGVAHLVINLVLGLVGGGLGALLAVWTPYRRQPGGAGARIGA